MNATLGKKLRFSDVVYAIGTTPKSLRLWLQRDLVEIHTPKPEGGGWTEYSFFDIAILALVRTFVNYGVDVPAASKLANYAVRKLSSEMPYLQNKANMPADMLAMLWLNSRLQVFLEGNEWCVRRIALYDFEPKDKDFDPRLPSGVATLRAEIEPAPVYLSIDVEAVLRTAFARAAESASEGGAD